MRFEELEFHRVGVWRGLAPLRLGPKLTLVLGDNEAGKSTSMRAIDALLFGPDDKLVAPLTSVSDFNASARVRLMDGTELGWRRQGRKAEPADAAERLAALAPPEHRATFRDLFRLGHDQVRADASFLSDDGALGRVLFAAESGASAASLNDTEKSLRDREKAAESGSRTGSGLKKIVGEFKEQKEKHDRRAGFRDYDRTGEEIKAVEDEIKALKAAVKHAREEEAKLKAWKEGLPQARSRQDALDQLALLEGAGHLASREQAQAIREALAKLEEGLEAQKQRTEKQQEAETALNVLPPVPPIAGYTAQVDELYRKVEAIRKDRTSLDEAKASLAETRRELRGLLASAFELAATDETVLAQGKALQVSQLQRRSFKALVEEGEQAEGEVRVSRRAMEEALRQRDQAKEKAEASAELPTEALSHALELVRALKALDDRLDALAQLRGETSGEARRLARRLGLTTLDEASIANLSLPSRDRLNEAFKQLDRARQAVETAKAKLDETQAKQSKARQEEQSLRDELQEAVTDAAFDAARQARDQAWQRVKATWTPSWKNGAQLDLPALGATFEGLLIEVDDLADRRFQNASQLGKLSKAMEHHETSQREVKRAEEVLAGANAEAATAHADWRAHWSFLEEAPDSHIDWLNSFDRLVENLDASARAATEHTQTLADRRTLKGDVANRLAADLPAAATLDTAAALQGAIQEELNLRGRHNEEARRRRNTHATLEATARDAAARHEATLGELTDWNDRWSRMVAALPANVRPEPAAVKDWLAQQETLARLCGELASSLGVIDAKTSEIEAFELRVQTLLARVRAEDSTLPVPASLSPLDALSELFRLATDAHAAKAQRSEKEKDLRYADEEAAKAKATAIRRSDELTARWKEGGFQVEWTSELIETETRRADEAHALRRQIEQCQATLRPLWKEEPDVVLAAIDGRNEDDLERDGGREAEKIRAIEDELEACFKRKSALEQTKTALESDGAAEVEQDLALVSDRLLDKANELATLKAALWLLGKAREKATQGAAPLVELASENFAQLTGDEYTRLEIDRDAATPTLRAIPAHGDSKKANELSDGTLDQLWLALRLAVVQQAAKNTPWPLVLDDVFVHFDDQRTTAALKLLARLSETVQVIVFTHHDHVVDLARAAVPEVLEVVTLARAEHRERLLPEVRERHERPEAPAAHRSERKTGAAESSSDVYGHILTVLENASAPRGKAEILEAVEQMFGVSVERDWNKTITQLVDDGRVVKEGEKRGAKYSLARRDDAAATG